MFSRRTRAVLDLLGNLFVLAPLTFLRLESRRIERLRQDGALEGIDNVESVDESRLENANLDARTAFALGLVEGMEDVRLRHWWALVGAASAIGYRTVYDRDVGGIRRSLERRLLLLASIWAIWIRLSLGNRSVSHSLGVGSSVGAVAYRTRYGLLSEPPPEN
ncbi:hypothetical protein AB7C87_03730 [Natrarchaeobius sp. A-rgal3]|uniref:hypothetical protein n=1 Tax=Natrarchaeobius versutus TaxID=1679078 RepID=UPI003510B6CD